MYIYIYIYMYIYMYIYIYIYIPISISKFMYLYNILVSFMTGAAALRPVADARRAARDSRECHRSLWSDA